MRRKIVIISVSLVFLTGLHLLKNQAWAQLTNWLYITPITVNENSGAALTDYQVLLTFDTQTPITAGKMNADGSDIRFAEDVNGTLLLNYWIESGINTNSTNIWVKIPFIAASDSVTIYLFYGNPAATTLSNADSTFLFYDDFNDGVLDTAKWEQQGPFSTLNETGGILILSGSSNWAYIKSKTSFNQRVIVQERHESIGVSSAFLLSSAITDERFTFRESGGGSMGTTHDPDVSGGNAWFDNSYPAVPHADNVYYDYTIIPEISGGFINVVSYCNESTGNCNITPRLLDQYSISSFSVGYSSYSTSYIVNADNIIVRNYASIEPTVNFGAETLISSLEITNDTSICISSSINLNITITDSAGFPAPYTFLWNPATGLSCTTCQNPVASPTSTTTYMVIVTDSTGAQDSAEVTITVFLSPPVADAGLDTTICEKDSVQLNANGGAYYSWNPSTALSDTSIANPYANPVTNITYMVTVSNDCGSDVDSVTVTVNPLPVISLTSDTAICPGDSVQLNAGGGVSYLWVPGSGLSDSTIANPIANPSVTTVYSITVISGFGCTNFDSLTVTVDSVSQILATTSKDTICPGDSAQLSVNACTPMSDDFDPGIDFSQWSGITGGAATTDCGSVGGFALYFNGAATREATTQNLNVSTGGTVDFYLKIGSGASPCETADANEDIVLEYSIDNGITWNIINTYFTGSYVVFTPINEIIPAGAQTAGTQFRWRQLMHSGTCCDHWAIDDINIACSGVDTTLSYIWTPSTGLSNPNIADPMASPPTTTTYIVNALIGSCSSSDTITIYVDTVTSMLASPDTTICNGDSVQLTATGSPTYVWSPATGLSCTNCQSPIASPATSTTYYVTTPSGCAPTDSVTVTTNGLAQITVSSSRDSICPGDTAQLSAIDTTMSYTWTPPTGLSNPTIYNPVSSPVTTTTYTLTVDDNGCTASDSITIYTVSLNIAVSANTTICPGDTILLNASSNIQGTSYSWTPASGLSCTNCPNPAAYPTSTTTYYVTGSSSSCNSTDSVTITVSPLPPVDAGVDTSYCFGGSVNLEALGAILFVWSPPAGLTCTSCPKPTASPSSTTTYYVTGTDANGCTNTDSITVTVSGVPITAVSSIDTICQGDAAQLDVLAGGAGMQDDFDPDIDFSLWSDTTGCVATNDCGSVSGLALYFNGNTTREAVTQSLNVSTGGTINFYIKFGTGASPCENADAGEDVVLEYSTDNGITWNLINLYDESAYSIFTSITEIIPVGAQTTSTQFKWRQIAFNGSCCDHWAIDDVDITTAGGTLDSNATITWSPSTGLSNPAIINPLASPPTTTTYVVTVEENGCITTDTITVYVNNTIIALTADVGICTGDSIQLSATSNNPIVVWSWNPTISLSDSTIANPIANPSSTTTYTVTATDAMGCQFTLDVTISVAPYPIASFTYSDSALTVMFTDSSVNAGTLLWDFGDGITSPLQNPTHTYADTGTYNVCLTVTNTCGSANICNTIFITSALGVAENYLENGINIYPNPNSGEFILSTNYEFNMNLRVVVYDVLGRVAWSVGNRNLASGNNEIEIDMSDHPAGIYNLQIIMDQGISNRKIIIE